MFQLLFLIHLTGRKYHHSLMIYSDRNTPNGNVPKSNTQNRPHKEVSVRCFLAHICY